MVAIPGRRRLGDMPVPDALGCEDLRTVLRIGAIVGHARNHRASAQEVLAELAHIVPYVAASVQAWNPLAGCHETLANSGYSSDAVHHLDDWFVAHDEAFLFMRDVDPRPIRWQDMPFDYRQLYSAQTQWIPAGYEEGVTTCLYSPDGRYTGNLHLNTESRRHPTPEAMSALTALQLIVSGLVDMLRVPTWMAASLPPEACAVILNGTGHTLDLPQRRPGKYLVESGGLLDLVRDMLAHRPDVRRFLWRDPCRGWHIIRLEPVEGGAVVIDTPTELPHELTARELDVLALLVEGRSNADIAAALVVSVKTVAKHVEHVLDKLECSSRTAAAVRATHEGLMRFPIGAPAPPLN